MTPLEMREIVKAQKRCSKFEGGTLKCGFEFETSKFEDGSLNPDFKVTSSNCGVGTLSSGFEVWRGRKKEKTQKEKGKKKT